MTARTWLIEPRDPLVFGDGRGATEVGAHATFPFPMPGTVAGMVRTAFYHAGLRDGLLDVHVERGPWITRRTDDGFEPWVPAPHDAVHGRFTLGAPQVSAFARSHLLRLREGESALWPHGPSRPGGLPLLTAAIARDGAGNKTRPASAHAPLWTLEQAVFWATSPETLTHAPEDDDVARSIRSEPRIHVKIDGATGAAEAGMLFSTPGLRFHEDHGVALEIRAPESATWPAALDRVLLGGEGRPCTVREQPNAAFPPFERFESQYRRGAGQAPSGIRVQLLTHAWMRPEARAGEAAWLPSWIDPVTLEGTLAGLSLRLEAVNLSGFTPISGWDLARPGPRRVRRLVPPGAVYSFRLHGDRDLVEAADALWGKPIEPGGDAVALAREHLAPPAHDGYGLMLPGFWWEHTQRENMP